MAERQNTDLPRKLTPEQVEQAREQLEEHGFKRHELTRSLYKLIDGDGMLIWDGVTDIVHHVASAKLEHITLQMSVQPDEPWQTAAALRLVKGGR